MGQKEGARRGRGDKKTGGIVRIDVGRRGREKEDRIPLSTILQLKCDSQTILLRLTQGT